jgi:hypothetical protein
MFARSANAAWEVATAVSLDRDNPRLVVRAAHLLFALGEREAAESCLDHAESLDDSDAPDLVGSIAYLRHKLEHTAG